MKLKNIIKDELIGLPMKVKNFEGRIIDETKNMIFAKKNHIIRSFQKTNNVFQIYYNKKWLLVDGKILTSRPEERIKKRIKK